MSKENNQPQGPTVEDVLTARVYVPALIAKCAELGVEIRNEEELNSAMAIAERVRMHKEANHIPQGLPQAPSLLKEAADGLVAATSAVHAGEDIVAGFMEDPYVKQALAVAGAPEPAAAG